MAKPFPFLAAVLGLATLAVAQDSCTTCHPGAGRGLAQSAHAPLAAQRPTDACIVCHTGSDAHVQSAKQAGLDPKLAIGKPPAVTAASCVACHAGKDFPVASGAHAFVRKVTRAVAGSTQEPAPASQPTSLTSARDPQRQEEVAGLLKPMRALGLDWSGLVAFGYRFVDVDGSRDRYDTDLRLHRGFRLSEIEIAGDRADPDAKLDRLRIRAEDIGDPWMRVRAEAEKDEGKLTSRDTLTWTKSRYAYRAAGEFHRVDQRSDELAFDVARPFSEEFELFGSFARSTKDGFWLTERVGNRNLAPVGSVSGVASPREIDAWDLAAGARGTIDGWGYSAAFEYHDDDSRERWSYARSSPINAAFPESETFLSHTTLRGPGVRTTLAKRFDKLHVSLSARWLSRDKRVSGDGTTQGYDIGEFTTATTAFATGSAETWLADLTAGYDISDTLALDVDLRWRDHREELTIDQTDVTTYPGLGSTTTVATATNPRTAQRVLEGSASLDWQPTKMLGLSGGYGFSREALHVPDLEAGDGDFEKGTLRSDGLLFGARFKPTKELRFDLQARTFGTGGSQLHELTQDEQRSLSAKARYTEKTWHAETFWKTTQVKNDRVHYLNDATTFGVSGGLTFTEQLELDAGWVYADLNSRVLTNFYFDPDPNPVPTFVGFKGDTHTLTGGATWHACRGVEVRGSGAYTTTNGSFDLDTWDWRIDGRYEVLPGGEIGVMFRRLDYSEGSHADDYDAKLLMIYWRQRIGRGGK